MDVSMFTWTWELIMDIKLGKIDNYEYFNWSFRCVASQLVGMSVSQSGQFLEKMPKCLYFFVSDMIVRRDKV